MPHYPERPSEPIVTDQSSLRHARLGVASLVIAIVAGLTDSALFVYAALAILVMPQLEAAPATPIIIGCGVLGALGLNLVGLTLGLIAVTGTHRNKVFAWIGVGFNSAFLLGVLSWLCGGTLLRQ